MHRFVAPYAFAIVVLFAGNAIGQNIATGTAAIPAAGRPDAAARPAARPPSEVINYDTIHLEKRITAIRASGSISLDGALDEPAWSEAPIANGFIQNDPHEGNPATYDTDVRVLYTDDALYFGVFAHDMEPSKIVLNDLKKDYNKDGNDGFRIVLDTFHDGRNGYEFMTNPAGAKWDSQVAGEGRDNNANWDGIWDVKTQMTENGWVAEIWIPFRTLKFSGDDEQVWGINFQRKMRRLNEDSYWAPLPRIYDIERISMAGTLEGLRGVHAGKNIRVKPYGLTSGSRVSTSSMSGDAQAGVDVKYGVTSGLVWDFTVNTDFSQVEADEQQVNLTRFSLFFPEKRDFFLENQGLFAFGNDSGGGGGNNAFGGRGNQPQDLRMFFTRRIGLSDSGNSLPILGGTRLSGRQGAYSIGLLNIQQREDSGFPATNFSAIRLRRDVFANSDIGAIVLDKEVNGPNFNRLAGADANFRFGNLQLTGFAAKSFSPLQLTAPRANSITARGNVQFTNRQWRTTLRYTTIGDGFNDELGFVPRVGVRDTYTQIWRSLRPKWLPHYIREVGPHWIMQQSNRLDGNALDQRQQDFHLSINLSDGAGIEPGINTNVEVIRAPFVLNNARGARILPGRYEYNEYFFYYRTNGASRLASNFRYSIGPFYGGYRRSYAFGPEFRPNEKMNATLTMQWNDISLPTVSYLSTLTTARVNYNFNTKMFLNALLQYSTDTHQLSSNIRFNVIHRPLSDIFFVYNEHRDEHTGLMQDRSLIAKMTYMMAF
ncbi:MAG TPA: DUF5916 domain-containing protein [Vicinamibacterales bacterium]|jgi:Domain of unknown function (DUF5916)/Carbohydrate family 9 binding domain-like|nr:DUF5916 domain-containing protein [Vicinamibacterales bacterium]